MKLSLHNTEIFISTGGREFDPSPSDGSSGVLLFIHGSGQSHLTFLQQGRFFANRGWQVLNPDMPAHGQSAGAPLQSIEEMARWYNDFLSALGIERVTVIGHSQGCLIGLEMAKRYPEKVAQLCLIAGALAIPVNEALIDMAANKPAAAYQAMVNWAHANESHLYDHSWPGMTHIEFGHKVMSGNDHNALLADLTACNNYDGGPDAAAAVQCKATIIIAGQDKMTPPKAGRKMAEALPGPDVHLIDDAGHFLPSEKPFEVNKIIRALLKT